MLVVLRFLLGIGEAGFTGVPFLLSFFYKRNELAYRTAMFVAAAPLATMFASSLAWLVLKLGEDLPIAPWRLLFLLDGFPSVLVAVVAWDAVVDPSPYIVAFPLASAVGYLVLALARPLGIGPVWRYLAVGFFNTIVLSRHSRGLDAADTGPDVEEARGLVDPAGDG